MDRERLHQLEQLCRQHGRALTAQRRAVLEAVLGCTDHPTADGIHELVKKRMPGISRTTVYRVLDTLVQIGAITKACSPGGATRYDPKTHRHHHLACLRCDKLIDLEDERLDRHIKLTDVQAGSFRIKDFSIHFRGLCAACRRKQQSKKSGPPKSAARGSRKQERESRRVSQTAKRRKNR